MFLGADISISLPYLMDRTEKTGNVYGNKSFGIK